MGLTFTPLHNEAPSSCLCPCSCPCGAPRPRNELTCQICVDIVTDLDNWLTDDKTEQEIVDFVKQLCAALGQLIPGFQATCDFLIESQLPSIIDGLVNDNLDPTTICTQTLGACP